MKMHGNGDGRIPRIACLGAGWIGRHRMRCLLDAQLVEVVAIVDPDLAAATAASKTAPRAVILRDVDALMELDLDGLMIATPSALHARQTIDALRAGISVFCQKPLGRDRTETSAAIEAARTADRLLRVDLSYRHVAGIAQMRELVQSGAIGDLFAVDLSFHNAYGPDKPWFYDVERSGGGCLIDLGTHLVDLALWVSGSRSAEVLDHQCYAQGVPLKKRDAVEDYATARLRLQGGVTANVACSWNLHAGCDAVIEAKFFGTAGAVSLRNVGGSFYDFVVEHHTRTSSHVIARPPDAWGGRAAAAWARTLALSPSYDDSIERVLDVASVVDTIYQQPSPPVGEAS